MRYKIKVDVVTEKRGLFGRRHKVVEKKTVYVDRKTYGYGRRTGSCGGWMI